MAKGMKASYTVEAALLLPVVVISLLLIWYTSCYMYDSCLLEKSVRAVALRGVCYQGSSQECKEYMEKEWRKLTKDKLLGSRILKLDITINSLYIKITCKTEYKLSKTYKKLFSNTYADTRLRVRGTDFIRTQYFVREVME